MPTIGTPNAFNVPAYRFSLLSDFYIQSTLNHYTQRRTGQIAVFMALRPGGAYPWYCVATDDPNALKYGFGIPSQQSGYDPFSISVSSNTPSTYTYDNKTVYYKGDGWIISNIEQIETNGELNASIWQDTSDNYRHIAWLMIYGDNIPDGYDVIYDLEGCTGASENPTIIPANATVTNANFTADTDYSFNSGSVWIDGAGYPEGSPVQFVWEPETGHLRIGVITSSITIHVHATTDPYSNIDGESDIPGGDTVNLPGLPSLTATSTGIIGLFAPTSSQMQLLADFMWADFGGTGTTTEDILKEIVEAFKRSISNPLDYVIGLNIIPSAGLSIGSSAEIRFGFVNSHIYMPRLTSQYFTVDCGSLSFDALCGDTFLDYAPYSKFSIYLPYIGVKDVDANDFFGQTIGVMYNG